MPERNGCVPTSSEGSFPAVMSTARARFEATVSVEGGRGREKEVRRGEERREEKRHTEEKRSLEKKSIPSLCGTQRGKFSFCVTFVCNRADLIEIVIFF